MSSMTVSIADQSSALPCSICVSYQRMRNLPDLAQALLPIVADAGAAIMAVYDGRFAVQHKLDDSPLTLADLESQRVINDGLRRLWPDIPDRKSTRLNSSHCP